MSDRRKRDLKLILVGFIGGFIGCITSQLLVAVFG